MTTTPRVLLIDLENYPSQIHSLMDDLDQYSQVIICYAQSGAKVPIDWLMRLTTAINNNRLTLFKVPSVGKNAADFGMTFWAGKLMAELPVETHFDIVSNDTDLDYVVSLLLDQKRSAKRIGNKKENLPVLADIKPIIPRTLDDYLCEYCLYLQKHSNRPAKRETLLNSINTKFKSESIDGNKIIDLLVKQSVIEISNNKITYMLEKIKQFANNL